MKVSTLPIVVINLDQRKDRWQTIKSDLEKVGLTKYERFSAICPTELIKTRPKYLAPKRILKYRIGCLGCLLSHYYVIKKAKEDGLDAIMILEDDAGFNHPEPLKLIQEAIDQLDGKFDMLYLSGTHMKPCIPNTKNTVRIQKTYATNAYIIKSSMFDFLLARLPHVDDEIDVFYTKEVQPRFRCFCIKPHVTFQRPGFSDIQNTKVNYAMKNP